MFLEQFAGSDIYLNLLKNSVQPEVQHRLLLAKWLYINGLLHDVFPVQEQFIPGHKKNGDVQSNNYNDDDEYVDDDDNEDVV
jgi:hypothetical protein